VGWAYSVLVKGKRIRLPLWIASSQIFKPQYSFRLLYVVCTLGCSYVRVSVNVSAYVPGS